MKKAVQLEKIGWVVFDLLLLLLGWIFLVTCTSAKDTFPDPVSVFSMLFTSFVKPIGTYTMWGHLMWS